MIVSRASAQEFLGKKLKGLGGGKRSYYVLSEDGSRSFGGPYTKAQAKKRLGQVEYFKHNPADSVHSSLIKPAIKNGFEPLLGPKKNGGFTRYRFAFTRKGDAPGESDVLEIAHHKASGGQLAHILCMRKGKGVAVAHVDGATASKIFSTAANILRLETACEIGEGSGKVKSRRTKKRAKRARVSDKAIREYLRGTRNENPASFSERPHNWDEVLIQKGGVKKTRRQIRDYYIRNEKRIWPFLQGQTVMVILAPKRNEFVRRRHLKGKSFIKLTKLKGMDDPKSFEYWINRRVIEFHPTLKTKSTPLLWLDLDMHTTKSAVTRKKLLGVMRRAIPKLKKVFKEMGVRRVHVYTSGTGGGFHLEGDLDKPKSVDALRRRFTKALKKAFEGDARFTTGLAKSGQVRLDTTTLHTLGSLRAPYSMTVAGSYKKPVK